MTSPVQPGGTLGVLGSGQLGRMFAIAARRLGYRVQTFSPEADTPAGQVCDREWTAAYDDLDALGAFARSCDAVTLEFENIPAESVAHVARTTAIRPGADVLSVAQHRAREKSTLRRLGLPTARFDIVHSPAELQTALTARTSRSILKTAAWGYDGKGQVAVAPGDDMQIVWKRLSGEGAPCEEAVLEEFVDFDCELSVIGVQGLSGAFVSYGPILNHHHRHILDVSVAPAIGLGERTIRDAVDMTHAVMRGLSVVGVLCVEMFLAKDGRLLINEIAPRPHNSGHLTIDAHVTCQFEQQVRAMCGLPLGSTRQRQPAAMANLLGEVWEAPGGPDWPALLEQPDVKLHLYGKAEPRPGRKMGHFTVLGDDPALVEATARATRRRLERKG